MNTKHLIRHFFEFLNFETELDDFDRIHESISKDVVFKGTNLWILMFAIIVASVGLNMNSTAVIIGAMLISPLMGPINGMGYSIATYNFPLFQKSIKNFSFAVIASLLASMTYFIISPISTAHSELLARTTPTIYDVVIALFGGLAGIVAISSRQKGNVIPGVAIATALMPPLCTAGYGLATAQFNYFFGAFYLFTINTVFIALSSVIISQILKFPIRTHIPETQKKRINRWISLVIILILIPSIYFGYLLVQKERFQENAKKYIHNISIFEGNFLLKHEINSDKRSIKLVYGGKNLKQQDKDHIIAKAASFSLKDVKIEFQQGLSFEAMDGRSAEIEALRSEINRVNLLLKEKDMMLDSIYSIRFTGQQILKEIQSIYPQIESCLYSKAFDVKDTLIEKNYIGIIVFKSETKNFPDKEARIKIYNWLKARLQYNKIKVFYEPEVSKYD